MFIGRMQHLNKLDDLYKSKKSCLSVIYGRRRIGKSELLKKAGANKNLLYFEGIEGGNTLEQISLFHKKMIEYFPNDNLQLYFFNNWHDVFDVLTKILHKTSKKPFIVFDEFQWLAAKQSKLVATIKIFWDQYWKNDNIMIILCGSIAHYMALNVIKSKALYGRIDYSLQLPPLELNEASQFFKKINDLEIIKYFSIFGTIPKYLELINPKKSFDENIINLFFEKESYFLDEIEKVFFSQFREVKNYKLIITKLLKHPLTQEEIAQVLKMKSGGGVKTYITNLINANFISPVKNLASPTSKGIKYKVVDEYIIFFFKYVTPHLGDIKNGYGPAIYHEKIKSEWTPWLGYAFEALCMKNSLHIAKCLGFDQKVISQGSFYIKNETAKDNVQIDLLYMLTNHRCVLFEIKNNKNKIEKNIIFEIESKIEKIKNHHLFKNQTIETGLIHVGDMDKIVVQMDYFKYALNLKKLLHFTS